jgi:cytidyltransferase-like protein
MREVDLFLTQIEKANIANWQPKFEDRSITTRLLSPFWDWIVRYVPGNVAPNVLTLSGLLCLVHAYYLCFMYMDLFPRTISIIAVFLAFASQTLDAIDGRHARITRNESPIGELFALCCDNVGAVFFMLIVCSIVGIKDNDLQWYIVQTAQLVFLQKHFSAFRTEVLHFSVLGGPGEALFVFMLLGIVRAAVGFDWLLKLYPWELDLQTAVLTLYYGIYFISIIKIVMLPAAHSSTRNGLIFCLLYRAFPGIVIHFIGRTPTTHWDIICDGTFLAVISSDLILAKMAKRELHPWIVLFAMLSIFHNLACIMLCAFYFVAVFYELCNYMNLPMFSINVNVYASGVFDLCHVGHMRLFENALKFGTRLYVGVCSDEDVTVYKRKPIMTMKERCEAVAACKYVHKVIPNAPCFDLPREFLFKHNIHIVALSEEYNKPDDKFYAGAREMGIDRVLPRTEGMSTSELIKRIRSSNY